MPAGRMHRFWTAVFRIASLGLQAVTWTVIAVAFGPLAERVLEPDHGRAASRSASPSSS